MKSIRFTSIYWLAVLPLLAVLKILWIQNLATPVYLPQSPFPLYWLNENFSLNLYLGITLIFIFIYFAFAYINAYIRLQTTYAIPLFLGIFSLFSFEITHISVLLASLFFVLGIFQKFSLRAKQQPVFSNFNAGFLMGFSLFFDFHFLLFIVLFTFFYRFSLRQFLQFFFGILSPLLFIFPILYFTDTLTQWTSFFAQSLENLSLPYHFKLLDISIILPLSIITAIQMKHLLKIYKKMQTRYFIYFLVCYFVLAMLYGIFIYKNLAISVLLVAPPMTLLFSLSKHENQTLPILAICSILLYFGVIFLT